MTDRTKIVIYAPSSLYGGLVPGKTPEKADQRTRELFEKRPSPVYQWYDRIFSGDAEGLPDVENVEIRRDKGERNNYDGVRLIVAFGGTETVASIAEDILHQKLEDVVKLSIVPRADHILENKKKDNMWAHNLGITSEVMHKGEYNPFDVSSTARYHPLELRYGEHRTLVFSKLAVAKKEDHSENFSAVIIGDKPRTKNLSYLEIGTLHAFSSKPVFGGDVVSNRGIYWRSDEGRVRGPLGGISLSTEHEPFYNIDGGVSGGVVPNEGMLVITPYHRGVQIVVPQRPQKNWIVSSLGRLVSRSEK